jgi:hypothetical protein
MNQSVPYQWKVWAIRSIGITFIILWFGIFCVSVFFAMNPASSVSLDQRIITLFILNLFVGLAFTACGALNLAFEKDIPMEARTGFLRFLMTGVDNAIVVLVGGIGLTLAFAISALIVLGAMEPLLSDAPLFLGYILFGSLLLGLLTSGVYRRLKARSRWIAAISSSLT